MNLTVKHRNSNGSLTHLVNKAVQALQNAETSAELLDAKEAASLAYDASKRAGRMARAKGAHDDLIAAAHRTQADALEIEALAKRKLADEYDAAQERGEVATGNRTQDFGVEGDNAKPATAADLGLRRDQIHEARQIRDAEDAQPGLVRQTLDRSLRDGREPTRAELQRSVIAAVELARKSPKRENRKNPRYVNDPLFRDIAKVSGYWEEIARRAENMAEFAKYSEIESTQRRLHRNFNAAFEAMLMFKEASDA